MVVPLSTILQILVCWSVCLNGVILEQSQDEVSNVAGVPVQQGFYTLTLDENDGYRLSMSDQVLVGTDVNQEFITIMRRGNYRFTASDADQDIHSGDAPLSITVLGGMVPVGRATCGVVQSVIVHMHTGQVLLKVMKHMTGERFGYVKTFC